VIGTNPVTLANSEFDRNTASSSGNNDGGGALFIGNVPATIVGCRFLLNHSNGVGGAIAYTGTTGVLAVHSSTFFGNSAARFGGGIRNNAGALTLVNDVFWDNTAVTDGAQIFNATTAASAQVSYCDIKGSGFTTNGNIDADPLFTSTTDPINLALAPGSPCRNTGSTASLPPDTADLDGDGNTTEPIPLALGNAARVQGAAVDMGAYESAP
jgi:hypothetical protein